MQTFFRKEDYEAYISLLGEWCKKFCVETWAYCLMPNHVHLMAVPETEDGLRRGIGEAHRRYSRLINFREGWRGHLWQGRFASFPVDENYLIVVARYIEMNPVRARLTRVPQSWRWSSAKAHLTGIDDELVRTAPLLALVEDWKSFLQEGTREEMAKIRKHERTGRPLGDESFIEKLEVLLTRTLKRQKPGPKTKGNINN